MADFLPRLSLILEDEQDNDNGADAFSSLWQYAAATIGATGGEIIIDGEAFVFPPSGTGRPVDD